MAKYQYDASAQRYRDPATGQFVSEDTVRGAADGLADQLSQVLANITMELVQGKSSVPDWQKRFADELVDHHLAAAAVAAGGLQNLKRAEPSAAQARLVDQLKFLRGFARDLETGRQPMDGRAVNRAKLYGAATRTAFEEQQRANWSGHVAMEERWVLSAAEHCSGCSAQAARGWVEMGSLPAVGSQHCRTNCRCRITRRRSPTSTNPCAVRQGRDLKTVVK